VSLPAPSYIPVDQLTAQPVAYVWNGEDPYEAIEWPDKAVKQLLSTLSNFAIIGFSLGCAEWVVYRLKDKVRDPIPFCYIDALWLLLMGQIKYGLPETDARDWQGSARGAVNLALMTTLNTLAQSEFGPPVQNGALSASIALHVLPDGKAFLEWQELALDRLHKAYPRSDDDPDGPPVSRLVLDPAIPLEQATSAASLDRVAKMVSRKGNPLLRP
jgi:hypothetical protein